MKKALISLFILSAAQSALAGACTALIQQDGLRTETVPMISAFQSTLQKKGYQEVTSDQADAVLKIGVKYTSLDGKDVTADITSDAIQKEKPNIQGFVSVILKYSKAGDANDSKTFAAQSGAVNLVDFVSRLLWTMISSNYTPADLHGLVDKNTINAETEAKLLSARADKEIVDQLVNLGARTIDQIPDCDKN